MSVLLVLIYSASMLLAGYQYRKHSETAPGHDPQAVRRSMLGKI